MLVFEGKTIGSTKLPKQNLVAGQSAPLTLDSQLQITDFDAFRSFATGTLSLEPAPCAHHPALTLSPSPFCHHAAISERESVTFRIEQPKAQVVVLGFVPTTARLSKAITVKGLGLNAARVTVNLPSTSGSLAQNNARIEMEVIGAHAANKQSLAHLAHAHSRSYGTVSRSAMNVVQRTQHLDAHGAPPHAHALTPVDHGVLQSIRHQHRGRRRHVLCHIVCAAL